MLPAAGVTQCVEGGVGGALYGSLGVFSTRTSIP